MANRERGEVSLDVEGKTYVLRPTFNSGCELETLTNKAIFEHMQEAMKGRMSAMRALMWSYLQDRHSDEIKTLKDAAEWIERAGGVMAVNKALSALVSLNGSEEVGGNKGNPPKPGIGAVPTSPGADAGSRAKSSGRARRANTAAH